MLNDHQANIAELDQLKTALERSNELHGTWVSTLGTQLNLTSNKQDLEDFEAEILRLQASGSAKDIKCIDTQLAMLWQDPEHELVSAVVEGGSETSDEILKVLREEQQRIVSITEQRQASQAAVESLTASVQALQEANLKSREAEGEHRLEQAELKSELRKTEQQLEQQRTQAEVEADQRCQLEQDSRELAEEVAMLQLSKLAVEAELSELHGAFKDLCAESEYGKQQLSNQAEDYKLHIEQLDQISAARDALQHELHECMNRLEESGSEVVEQGTVIQRLERELQETHAGKPLRFNS